MNIKITSPRWNKTFENVCENLTLEERKYYLMKNHEEFSLKKLFLEGEDVVGIIIIDLDSTLNISPVKHHAGGAKAAYKVWRDIDLDETKINNCEYDFILLRIVVNKSINKCFMASYGEIVIHNDYQYQELLKIKEEFANVVDLLELKNNIEDSGTDLTDCKDCIAYFDEILSFYLEHNNKEEKALFN